MSYNWIVRTNCRSCRAPHVYKLWTRSQKAYEPYNFRDVFFISFSWQFHISFSPANCCTLCFTLVSLQTFHIYTLVLLQRGCKVRFIIRYRITNLNNTGTRMTRIHLRWYERIFVVICVNLRCFISVNLRAIPWLIYIANAFFKNLHLRWKSNISTASNAAQSLPNVAPTLHREICKIW